MRPSPIQRALAFLDIEPSARQLRILKIAGSVWLAMIGIPLVGVLAWVV